MECDKKLYVLECINKNSDVVKICGNVSVVGLGLEFVDLVASPNDDKILIGISHIKPGGTAEKSGIFLVGDVLISVSDPIYKNLSLENLTSNATSDTSLSRIRPNRGSAS